MDDIFTIRSMFNAAADVVHAISRTVSLISLPAAVDKAEFNNLSRMFRDEARVSASGRTISLKDLRAEKVGGPTDYRWMVSRVVPGKGKTAAGRLMTEDGFYTKNMALDFMADHTAVHYLALRDGLQI